jgi:imidazolonepropionase-like amidohydrolase
MVHANGLMPVQEALDAGCHSVEHGYFMGRENLEKLAQSRVAWVPTVIPMASYAGESALSREEADVARRTVEHQLEQLRTARALGVNVVLGTDSGSLGVEHGKAVTQELRLLVDAGYSIEAALECATARGAELLGMRDRLGRMAPGMPASFVVIDGPPAELLDRLGTPHSVWVRGQMVRCKEEERQE